MDAFAVTQRDTRSNCNEDTEVVFVVRVRQPTASTPEVGIRGRVEHLQSQSSGYFKDCEALCEFMSEYMGV